MMEEDGSYPWNLGIANSTVGAGVSWRRNADLFPKPRADLTQLRKKNVPGGARTYNLRLRRPTLYPIELREHLFLEEYLGCEGWARWMRFSGGQCRAYFSMTAGLNCRYNAGKLLSEYVYAASSIAGSTPTA